MKRTDRVFASKVALILPLSLVALLLVGVQPASADDTQVFDLSGTFTGDSTVSGTVTIDVSNGTITAVDLSYEGQTYTYIQTQGAFFGATGSTMPVSYGFDAGVSSTLQVPQLSFGIPGTSAIDSLVGYTGGSLCSLDALCGPDSYGNYWESDFLAADGTTYLKLQSGQLSATPEPSSVLLLATGIALIGMAMSVRRRKQIASSPVC